MNKRDISEEISQKLNLKKYEAYHFIDILIEVMANHIKNGEKIVISNFGTFKLMKRNKKKVVNPNDQKSMIIPTRKIVKFIASKNLKTKIQEN